MTPISGFNPAIQSITAPSTLFDLKIGIPNEEAELATGDSVTVAPLPVAASARVRTPTTVWPASTKASNVLAAFNGVPAKIILK